MSLCLLLATTPALADGAMVVRQRVLMREGQTERGYCDTPGAECDRVKTKLLSGYNFLSGHALGAIAVDVNDAARPTAAGVLHLNAASAALPGGDIAVVGVDAVLAPVIPLRLRVTLLDMEGQFLCKDAQNGAWLAPLLGMATRLCKPDAVAALDAGLLAVQWDVAKSHWQTEWLHLGASFELLSNGLGYAHLLRSVMLGLFTDLRSLYVNAEPKLDAVAVGAGARLSALYRTPHWETRVRARYRLPLAQSASSLAGQALEGELRFVHNFFLTDTMVAQLGVSLAFNYAQQRAGSFALLTPSDRHVSGFAGIYLGWTNESPDI